MDIEEDRIKMIEIHWMRIYDNRSTHNTRVEIDVSSDSDTEKLDPYPGEGGLVLKPTVLSHCLLTK